MKNFAATGSRFGPLGSPDCRGSPGFEESPAATGPAEPRGLTKTLESPVFGLLREVHAKFLTVRDGAVASYIPELEQVAPDQFGIAMVTADGFLYEIGESRSRFTIQSISKPLIYGLALQDHGRERVLARIGVEPSGDPFNAIVFDDQRNRPFNAMVNTGAIATTSLVHGNDDADQAGADSRSDPGAQRPRDRDRRSGLPLGGGDRPSQPGNRLSRTEQRDDRGRSRGASRSVFSSMRDSDIGGRPRLYRRHPGPAASHPVTSERALAAEVVRDVLSVMTTCGMYDYAGEWELRVGLPAKSGVGGGIMAVLPGQLGIGVFSPRLDEHGNSLSRHSRLRRTGRSARASPARTIAAGRGRRSGAPTAAPKSVPSACATRRRRRGSTRSATRSGHSNCKAICSSATPNKRCGGYRRPPRRII